MSYLRFSIGRRKSRTMEIRIEMHIFQQFCKRFDFIFCTKSLEDIEQNYMSRRSTVLDDG